MAMANITTAVKIAVDSSDLDNATRQSEDLGKNADKASKNMAAFTQAAGAAYAAITGVTALTSKFSDAWAQAGEDAYDFSTNIDSNLRTQLIWLREQQNVYNAELDKSNSLLAIMGAQLDAATTKAATFFSNALGGFSDAEERAEQLAIAAFNATEEADGLRRALRAGALDADEFADKYWEGLERFKDAQQDVANDMEASFRTAFEQQLVSADLTLDRVEKRQQLNAMRIEELRRQATHAEQENLSEFYTWQADQLEELFKKNEEYYAKLDQEAADSRRIQAAEDLRALFVRNQDAEVQLSDRIRSEEMAWKERYDQGLIDHEEFEIAKQHINEYYEQQRLDLQERANAEALKVSERAARDMANATSSALSILDDDLANLFDSINSLVSVLQTLEIIQGVGGVFGGFGGFGGGGFSGSPAGMSTFNSGVSVGTVSVTVNGGSKSVAGAARQGVDQALQGIVTQQLARESQFGGILNPSSGVTKV